ncbi:hypothetical protein [Amycolatopsis solani]|uniref:hypothetical protein n=1 Tax=Amycolatopsis solani TaxID=3028615 RepID=UPI00296F1BD0|nr:hypothetical protein [Amycolatopsis sp. MEP2-6]
MPLLRFGCRCRSLGGSGSPCPVMMGDVLFAPTSTAELLTHVVNGAEEAGYSGLMVALLRNADAGRQLAELSNEWTSLNDVTGRLIAVLSPDPEVWAVRGQGNVASYAAGQDLRIALGGAGPRFERGFADSVHAAQRRARAQARRPGPPDEHRDAWTEAAGRCASYFGVDEALIPAVLVLSFRERTALLIRLPSRSAFSLYDLCKRIAAELGWSKSAAELVSTLRALRGRQARLQRIADPSWKPYESLHSRLTERLEAHLTAELRAQYDSLDRHLQSVTEVAPALVGKWRENLAGLRSHGTVEEVYRQLFAIREHTVAPRERHRWRRLAAAVGKVIAVSDRVVFRASERIWDLDDPDPIAAAVEQRAIRHDREVDEARRTLPLVDRELSAVAARLAEAEPKRDSERGLAEAAEAAARHLLELTDPDVVDGSGGLRGYTLRVVQARSGDPVATSGNTVHGDVFGTVLQAGRIDGDVHIHQPGCAHESG